MEVDRELLTKLLQAFLDASEYWHREAMFYQALFSTVCRTNGLTEEQETALIERGRVEKYPEIQEACKTSYLELSIKLPQLLERLGKEQEFAAILAKLSPQMRPN